MEILPIINQTYELYKFVLTFNAKLEKRWRYSLGASLEKSVMDLLEELILAKNAPKSLKSAYLLKASSFLEIITLKLRACLELGLANETCIFQTQTKLKEIGRMLGGWLKSVL